MKYLDEIKGLIKNTGIFFLGMLGSKIIIYLLTPIYTSYLTTDEYGIGDIYYTTIQILIPIITVKISSAMYRFAILKEKPLGKLFSNGVTMILFSGAVLLCIYSFIYNIFKLDVKPYVFVGMFCVVALNEVFGQFSKSLDKNAVYAESSIITALSMFAINYLMLVKLHRGVEGYFNGIIFSNVISIIFIFLRGKLYSYFNIKNINMELFKEMISYSWPLVPGALSFWIMQVSDRYMVLFISGVSMAGILATAYKIPSICGTLVNIFIQAWEISSIKTVNQEKYHMYVYKKYFSLVIIASTLLIFFSNIICGFLFRGDFIIASKYVPALIYSYIFCYFQSFLESIFISIKETKTIMYSTVIGALVNIILNIVLINIWGLMGAVISTGISYFIVYLIRYGRLYKSKRMMKYSFYDIWLLLLELGLVVGVTAEINRLITYIIAVAILIFSGAKLLEKA